jgi:hypothetical protein
LESFPNHPHFQKELFELGWNNLLGHNLKKLLETLEYGRQKRLRKAFCLPD